MNLRHLGDEELLRYVEIDSDSREMTEIGLRLRRALDKLERAAEERSDIEAFVRERFPSLAELPTWAIVDRLLAAVPTRAPQEVTA